MLVNYNRAKHNRPITMQEARLTQVQRAGVADDLKFLIHIMATCGRIGRLKA